MLNQKFNAKMLCSVSLACVFVSLLTTVDIATAETPSKICDVKPVVGASRNVTARQFEVDYQKGFGIQEIAPGVYVVSDGSFSNMFVVTNDGVVLIDAPVPYGAKLKEIIASVTDKSISHLVYTHGHSDHVGGATHLKGTFEVIASEGAARELAQLNKPDRKLPFGVFVGGGGPIPTPTTIVAKSHTIQAGGRTIKLQTMTVGHSHGDMIAYLPEFKIIMAVDFTWPAAVPWVRLGDAVSVAGFIEQNKELLSYDFDKLVAGHFAVVGNKGDVETMVTYLTDLKASSIAALKGVSVQEIGQELGAYDTFPLMDAYFQRVVDVAAEPVMAKWKGKLDGADVWTCAHAEKMISALRFDQMSE
jgi:glyoxylase-like metal-dependent hydrolase (beta-lactamase superfamily II)